MLIAQISDLHVCDKGVKAYDIAPMNQNLEHCIDHINELTPRPDLVLVTGDITHNGRQSEAEYAAQILAKLQMPYYICPGNHDEGQFLRRAFGEQVCPSLSEEFINYSLEGHDLRLIAMDSTKPGEPGGKLCEKRLVWLDECLSQQPDQPTIIFMHHPPVRFGILETDEDGFEGADQLGEVISKYSNIERIICGHVHLPGFAKWCGTVVSTAPSMGTQLMLDLTLREPSQFYNEDPAYQLHYWTPDKNLVSHNVRVGKRDGPYLFEGCS